MMEGGKKGEEDVQRIPFDPTSPSSSLPHFLAYDTLSPS